MCSCMRACACVCVYCVCMPAARGSKLGGHVGEQWCSEGTHFCALCAHWVRVPTHVSVRSPCPATHRSPVPHLLTEAAVESPDASGASWCLFMEQNLLGWRVSSWLWHIWSFPRGAQLLTVLWAPPASPLPSLGEAIPAQRVNPCLALVPWAHRFPGSRESHLTRGLESGPERQGGGQRQEDPVGWANVCEGGGLGAVS